MIDTDAGIYRLKILIHIKNSQTITKLFKLDYSS